MQSLKMVGVDVFLARRKTRLHVGVLKKVGEKLVFTYDDRYFAMKNIIPLGPEFPLTQKEFTSHKLFPSLEDRIPSQRNPAYPEYCQLVGIDPGEENPLVLLSTIGAKGPSSFIFSPLFERDVKPEEVVKFRKLLGLTTREFGRVFEFSQTSLNALERGKISGKDVLKRLEIIMKFPSVALNYLVLNQGCLAYDKWVVASEQLKKRARSSDNS